MAANADQAIAASSPAASRPSQALRWGSRNRTALLVFAPVLIATGTLGFFVPPDRALMSGATPYNLFHIASGVLGLAFAWRGGSRAAARFNLTFGAIDLWQALAGLLGIFPAALFGLRPADHALHVGLGTALCLLGWAGQRR